MCVPANAPASYPGFLAPLSELSAGRFSYHTYNIIAYGSYVFNRQNDGFAADKVRIGHSWVIKTHLHEQDLVHLRFVRIVQQNILPDTAG